MRATASGRSSSGSAPSSAAAKRRRGRPDVVEQRVPTSAEPGEGALAHHEAEIGAAALDRLEPGIAAGKQADLDRAVEPRPRLVAQSKIGLEADQVVLASRRPALAAQVVLAASREPRRARRSRGRRRGSRASRDRARERQRTRTPRSTFAPASAARASSASSSARRDRLMARNGSGALDRASRRARRRRRRIGTAPSAAAVDAERRAARPAPRRSGTRRRPCRAAPASRSTTHARRGPPRPGAGPKRRARRPAADHQRVVAHGSSAGPATRRGGTGGAARLGRAVGTPAARQRAAASPPPRRRGANETGPSWRTKRCIRRSARRRARSPEGRNRWRRRSLTNQPTARRAPPIQRRKRTSAASSRWWVKSELSTTSALAPGVVEDVAGLPSDRHAGRRRRRARRAADQGLRSSARQRRPERRAVAAQRRDLRAAGRHSREPTSRISTGRPEGERPCPPQPLEEGERRAVAEGQRVDAREVDEAAAERLVVRRRRSSISSGRGGAAAPAVNDAAHEADAVNNMVSADSPGPKAMAQPRLAGFAPRACMRPARTGWWPTTCCRSRAAPAREAASASAGSSSAVLDRVEHRAAAGVDGPEVDVARPRARRGSLSAPRLQRRADRGRHLAGQEHVEAVVADRPGDLLGRPRAPARRGSGRARARRARP